ncbi:hypothetical protein [Anaerobaca lacustris]|uniref:Glycosyltransferase RgtA/B/C/D-like domain-containing protein n=1 Tax=Anaerobaca lacustris TaxID=3044600 RepID=A0AAW6U1Q0_9BACT|nr:hypothetical protein [Sedimentisphaerales bacterium M17dextr]
MERRDELGQDGCVDAAEPSANRTVRAMLACTARLLGSRYVPAILAVAAVAVSLPAVGKGLLNDDYMQRATVLGPSPFLDRLAPTGLAPDGPMGLRRVLADLYIAVDPERNFDALRAYGALPWWTYEGYRVAFWRPVAALTHWLDHRLFPNSLALMHLHSILWFAAVVWLVAALYRRFIDAAPVAGLAALLFLLDDGSYFPTMWLANRNLLICLFFGILSVVLHDRWRRDRWRPAAVLAPLCLSLSLLSAEAGIATVAYLFAYEAVLMAGRWRGRVLALAPAVGVVVLWRLVYNVLGYGASGGGFYFDPVREPVDYVIASLQRAPFLLAGQWTTIPPELYSFLPPTSRIALWLVLSVLTVLIPLQLWPFFRLHRRSRFWLVGMVLSAVPFCATLPMSRSLLFVAIGAFGLIAEFIASWLADAWDDTGRITRIQAVYARPRWLWVVTRNLFVVFVVVHLPLAAAGRVMAPRVADGMQKRVARTMDLGPLRGVQRQDVVVVNAPNPASFLYEPYLRAYEEQTLPRGFRLLAPGFDEVEVARPSANVLTVRSVSQGLFDCQREGARADFVYFFRYLSDSRGPGHPLKVGDRFVLDRMTAEVLAVDDAGLPQEVAFEFDVALEDASLRWRWWDWDKRRYKPFVPPPIGEAVILAGPF